MNTETCKILTKNQIPNSAFSVSDAWPSTVALIRVVLRTSSVTRNRFARKIFLVLVVLNPESQEVNTFFFPAYSFFPLYILKCLLLCFVDLKGTVLLF